MSQRVKIWMAPRGLGLPLALLFIGAAVFDAGAAPPATPPPTADGGHAALIERYARHYSLDVDLVRALIWRESKFDARAVGSAGEVGLMQITTGAAIDWAKTHGLQPPRHGEMFDPAMNIAIGTWYLARARLHWQTRHRDAAYILALCEYNAGRRGMASSVKARQDGSVAIDNPKLHQYVSSILEQYWSYTEERRSLVRNLR